MFSNASHGLPIVLFFILGGAVKGVAGMGLPTIAMGLLGLLMPPAEAAALIVVPSLVTNLWQFLSGRRQVALLRRTWPMLLTMCLATSAGAGLMTGTGAENAKIWLGGALVAYAIIGLGKVGLTVPQRQETWLSPLVGAATGVVTGATGVFVIPAVPYLQALGFEKDDLVQVLGLSFTTSTLALAAGLASEGAFHLVDAGASALCTLPALLGMGMGQIIRARTDPSTFRLLFFAGLLLLGADLLIRPML